MRTASLPSESCDAMTCSVKPQTTTRITSGTTAPPERMNQRLASGRRSRIDGAAGSRLRNNANARNASTTTNTAPEIASISHHSTVMRFAATCGGVRGDNCGTAHACVGVAQYRRFDHHIRRSQADRDPLHRHGVYLLLFFRD